MKPRERVLTALNHKEPDRVPIGLISGEASIANQIHSKILKIMGYTPKGEGIGPMQGMADLDERVLQRFGADFREVSPKIKKQKSIISKMKAGKPFKDKYGTVRKMVGLYYEIVKNPLKGASMKELNQYEWPKPKDYLVFDGVQEKAKKLQDQGFAVCGSTNPSHLLEKAIELRGMTEFMRDLAKRKEFASTLLDKILRLLKQSYTIYLNKVGSFIDVIRFGDDLGMQTGPLISLSLYKELIKPRHQELMNLIKNKTDAKLYMHSCGSIKPFIPELIECGIDILNPIQVSAKGMDTRELKEKFGNKLVFWGGCDTQDILPHGSPADVKKEVKKRIKDLAPGGGYIFSQVHNIQPDVPVKNVIKMFDTALKFGRYPIK